MKRFWNILGVVLIIVGVIWILQGANILPGSFMTGQIEWFFAEIVTLIIGIALPFYMSRRRQNTEK